MLKLLLVITMLLAESAYCAQAAAEEEEKATVEHTLLDDGSTHIKIPIQCLANNLSNVAQESEKEEAIVYVKWWNDIKVFVIKMGNDIVHLRLRRTDGKFNTYLAEARNADYKSVDEKRQTKLLLTLLKNYETATVTALKASKDFTLCKTEEVTEGKINFSIMCVQNQKFFLVKLDNFSLKITAVYGDEVRMSCECNNEEATPYMLMKLIEVYENALYDKFGGTVTFHSPEAPGWWKHGPFMFKERQANEDQTEQKKDDK